MATLPSNQLIHIEINVQGIIAAGGAGSKNVANIFQFRRTDPSKSVDKGHIESAFQTALIVPLLAMLNVAYTQTTTVLRWLNDATDAPQPFAEAGVGAITTARSQDYDAVCFQLKTLYRGRSGKGSKHFGPLSDADTLGDVLTGGALTAWTAYKATLLAGFTDSDTNIWKPVIVSKGAAPPAPTSQLRTNPTFILANDVTQVLLNKTLGTMRRRKVRTIAV